MAENIDVTVIGAGQAGLAIGYYLSKTDLKNFFKKTKSQKNGIQKE